MAAPVQLLAQISATTQGHSSLLRLSRSIDLIIAKAFSVLPLQILVRPPAS
jgi:hypothetical protein